jgi:hypothetical protein
VARNQSGCRRACRVGGAGEFELGCRRAGFLAFVWRGIGGYSPAVKKIIALLLAIASGVYLLTIGLMPDPIPFIDEGVALIVLLNSLAHLGLDLRGIFGKGKGKKPQGGQTIDID